jgi:hypothetical protein
MRISNIHTWRMTAPGWIRIDFMVTVGAINYYGETYLHNGVVHVPNLWRMFASGVRNHRRVKYNAKVVRDAQKTLQPMAAELASGVFGR